MSVDPPGPSDPTRAAESPYRWTYDERGALYYDRDPGIPDGPLRQALRAAAYSSLWGFLLGVLLVAVAGIFGWYDSGFGIAALASNGMAPIRRGYRLRAFLSCAVTTAAILVLGVWLLGNRLPDSWEFFLSMAFGLAAGSQAGTAAAYLRRPRDAAAWPAGS